MGGIKEKILAAHRSGERYIILPWANKKDLEDVPEEVLKEICFSFVTEIAEVLRLAIPEWMPKKVSASEINQ